MNKQELLSSIMDQVVDGKYSKERIERFLASILELVSIRLTGNPFVEPDRKNVIDMEAFRQQRNGESDI